MNRPAYQIHSYGSPDRRNVIRSKRPDHRLQRSDHIIPADDHFMMMGADVVCYLPGIFEIDRIQIHADGPGLKRLLRQNRRNSAHQGGIQSA